MRRHAIGNSPPRMSPDFDVSALDQAPPRQSQGDRMAVMWPEELPAYNAPAEVDGFPMATVTAVILVCIAAGGAAALFFRDAIVALVR